MFRRAWIVAFLLLASCEKHSNPTVAIDNWWTVDFARNECPPSQPCGANPDDPGGVYEYINKLKAEFAIDPMCQGVSVLDFRGPKFHNPDIPEEKETLIIDYDPTKDEQSFSIMGQPSNGIFGTAGVQGIVRRTCAAARGLGATVH